MIVNYSTQLAGEVIHYALYYNLANSAGFLWYRTVSASPSSGAYMDVFATDCDTLAIPDPT